MQIVEVLKNKNVKVIEIPKWGTYLRKMWEEKFADHMSIEERKLFFYMMTMVPVDFVAFV